VHTRQCSIEAVCREALDEVRAAHPQRQFDFTMIEDTQWQVDPARLRQALSNLLNNAVQHGDPDASIKLAVAVEDAQLTIRVQNRGEPIPAESLQVIFDPLVQLSEKSAAAVDKTSTNLGLGLFIAREVATGHKGTLEASSDAANGTEFVLRIPVAA
jgi:signal transduction histidine kinase